MLFLKESNFSFSSVRFDIYCFVHGTKIKVYSLIINIPSENMELKKKKQDFVLLSIFKFGVYFSMISLITGRASTFSLTMT